MTKILPVKSVWLDEYSRLAEIFWHDDDTLTLTHIRNFSYDRAGRCTPHWYEKTLRISDITRVNLVMSRWGSEHIAHVFLSFGFADGSWLAISVETRRTVYQPWSAMKGFFFYYPIAYIVGDERDLIGVRTNVRGERVQLYDLLVSKEVVQSLFRDYLRRIDAITSGTEKYHTLMNNCTTNILRHARVISPSVNYHWQVLLSGHTDRYCYNRKLIDTRLPFDDIRRCSRIIRPPDAGIEESFSREIRASIEQAINKKLRYNS